MLTRQDFVNRTAKGIADGVADFVHDREALSESVSPSLHRR
jgi:hypothetical protein